MALRVRNHVRRNGSRVISSPSRGAMLAPAYIPAFTTITEALLAQRIHLNRWESVKRFSNGLGKLNLQHILKVHKIKFY